MQDQEPAKPDAAISQRSYRVAIGVVLLLIVYGSLYPLTWDFAHPQDFVFGGRVGLSDLVENVILFMPLGWLLAWHFQGDPRRRPMFWAWAVKALAVAALLQWLQKYLPRTPAVSDIAFNMVGHVAGWWTGAATAHLVRRALLRHHALDAANRFALLMVGLWLVAELFPLVPTFDVSSLAANIKSLWKQSVWQPRRMLSHLGMTVIGLEALAQLLRSVSRALPVRGLAVAALCAVLAGKFVVIHQSPGMAVVLGIAGGGLLWAAVDCLRRWPGDRPPVHPLTVLLCIAVANYLVYALWPLGLRRVPEPMSWLPFASSLSTSVEAVISSVAFECLCFGAIVWTAARRGCTWTSAAACTALLAFLCEWTQRYLPTRTPEITSVLLALAMGWLVAALDSGRGEMLAVPRQG